METPLLGPDAGAPTDHSAKRFGLLTSYAFCVNYIVGVGILDMPAAFYHAGYVLGPLMMFLLCCAVTLGVMWVVETSTRAWTLSRWIAEHSREVLDATSSKKGDAQPSATAALVDRDHVADGLVLRTILRDSTGVSVLSQISKRDNPKVDWVEDVQADSGSEDQVPSKAGVLVPTEKPFEVNELMEIFCPVWVKMLYELCLISLLMLALWSYTSVFGVAVVAKLPIFDWNGSCDAAAGFSDGCEWSFRVIVFLYAVVVVALSCTEFTEMVWFQVTLTVARFGLIGVILATTFFGIWFDPVDNNSTHDHAPYASTSRMFEPTVGIPAMISAGLFSQLISFGVPDIVEPMQNKRNSRKLFLVAMFSTAGFYTVIGLSASLYFGDLLADSPPINLLFNHYAGGQQHATWWAKIIEFYVLLFPALDVLSMFPLVAITLGNSINVMITGILTHRRVAFNATVVKIISRLLASVPPVMMPMVNNNINEIIAYTALPGAFIALLMPALIQFFSRRTFAKIGLNKEVVAHNSFLSHEVAVLTMFAVAAVLYFFIIVSTFKIPLF